MRKRTQIPTIGRLKRVFRKLGVNPQAELVLQIAALGAAPPGRAEG